MTRLPILTVAEYPVSDCNSDAEIDSDSEVELKHEKLTSEIPFIDCSSRACVTLVSAQENEGLSALETERATNSLQNDVVSLDSSIFGSSMSEDNWTNETDKEENDNSEYDDEAVIDNDPSGDYVDDEKLLDYASGYDDFIFEGKVKKTSSTLEAKSHKSRKSQKKSFKCNVKSCGRSFNTLVGLHLHQRIHPGKPSICDRAGCNMKFLCPNDLTKHKMKEHPEDKPHICNMNECGKRFTRFSDLRKHQKTHTKEKLKCSSRGCDKTFSRPKHMEMHSNNKRFKCQFSKCNKGFGCQSDLTRHSRSHAGFKPFYCTWKDCNARFTRAEHLRRHQKVHTGEEQFKCTEPGCTANYRYLHILRIHREETGHREFIVPPRVIGKKLLNC